MSRLLISTAVAGILAFAGAALAQDRDDHHGGPPGGGHPPAAHGPGPGPQAARPAPPQRQPDNRPRMDQRPSAAGPAAAPAPRNAMRGPAPGAAMRGPAPGAAMRGPAPGNAMRGPGGHADFSSYHRNFSATQRFHAPTPYRRPSGWYAHRWTYGQILPRLFWTQDYWLTDFGDFGLMPPPPGTVWVRDGSDALLIDQYSGEIIQVDYGVFY